jgi:hypothetical protein
MEFVKNKVLKAVARPEGFEPRPSVSGPGGRWFKSTRPDHSFESPMQWVNWGPTSDLRWFNRGTRLESPLARTQ